MMVESVPPQKRGSCGDAGGRPKRAREAEDPSLGRLTAAVDATSAEAMAEFRRQYAERHFRVIQGEQGGLVSVHAEQAVLEDEDGRKQAVRAVQHFRTDDGDAVVRLEGGRAVRLELGSTLRFGRRAVVLVDEVPAEAYRDGSVFLHSLLSTEWKNVQQRMCLAAQGGCADVAAAAVSLIGEAARAAMIGRPKFANSRTAARRSGFVVPLKGQERPSGPALSKAASSAVVEEGVDEDDGPDPHALVLEDGPPVVSVDRVLTKSLRPHQREGLQFLYDCCRGRAGFAGRGAILADEMGLGKTLQAVSLVWTLLRSGRARQAVIVAPSSLCDNWAHEFRRWLPRRPVRLVMGSQVEAFCRRDGPHRVGEILVLSYSQVLRHEKALSQTECCIDVVVADEGHRLKNPVVRTVQVLRSMKAPMRVVLTGTPVQNDLGELYALVDYANPGLLGPRARYEHVFGEPILRAREPNASALDRAIGEARAGLLAKVSGGCMLRRTAELLRAYLPPKSTYVLFCRPSPLQWRLAETVREYAVGDAALTGVTYLQKLLTHPWLLWKTLQSYAPAISMTNPSSFKNPKKLKDKEEEEEEEEEKEFGCKRLFPEKGKQALVEGMRTCKSMAGGSLDVGLSGKLAVLEALMVRTRREASSRDDRFVIVSMSTQSLDVVARLCVQHMWPYVRLDGGTAVGKRQAMVDEFNAASSRTYAFLLSSKAGGVGLNLIGANRLVLLDASWNPSDDLQAMARVHRQGQRKPCFIYRLLSAGTLEERIFQRQVNKVGLSNAIVDGKPIDPAQAFSADDLRDLFSLRNDTRCDTHDRMRCARCDSALSVALPEPPRCGIVRKKLQPSCSELLAWNHSPFFLSSFVDPVLSSFSNDSNDSNSPPVSFIFSLEGEN